MCWSWALWPMCREHGYAGDLVCFGVVGCSRVVPCLLIRCERARVGCKAGEVAWREEGCCAYLIAAGRACVLRLTVALRCNRMTVLVSCVCVMTHFSFSAFVGCASVRMWSWCCAGGGSSSLGRSAHSQAVHWPSCRSDHCPQSARYHVPCSILLAVIEVH